MPPHIDYYFTVLSPFAYLAGSGLEDIAEKYGATIDYKPVDIMRLFAEAGGTPPAQRHESRKAYRLQELKRLSEFTGLKLNLQPAHWPTDQKPASATIVAAQRAGADAGVLTRAILAAVWAEDRDIADAGALAEIVDDAGIDPNDLRPHIEGAVAAFDVMTEEALGAGVFGAPFYIVDGERFWGQDRLALLDWHLGGRG